MLKKLLLLLAVSFTSSVATAAPLKEAMLRDLDFVYQNFQARYAPAEWKNKFSNGWTMYQSIEDAKAEVGALEQPTLKDYRRILHNVFNAPRDYHVSVRFFTTERATLPFQVMGVGDKYFVVWIDREKLSENTFPVEIGDEVVDFGGQNTHDVVMKIKEGIGYNVEGTDKSLAELYLTRRAATVAMDVPKGPISITFKNKKGDAQTLQVMWEYSPEQIPDLNSNGSPFRLHGVDSQKKPFAILDKKMEPGFWSALKEMDQSAAENPFGLGTRKSFIPALGPKVWESADSDNFYAYIYKNADGKLIGYIRISSYSADNEQTQEFLKIITRMEQVTDGLVLDQVHNPGGSVFYLYSLVSLLSDKPMRTPAHRMSILQQDVFEVLPEIAKLEKVKNDEDAIKIFQSDNVGGYPVNYQVAQFFLSYMKFQVDQFTQGKTLSDPYFLGIDQIMPHPKARYTKPILLVVDQLDFSGGDFFPAIMQDNKRATIFGTRTAGAGGYIVPVQHQNILGVQQFVLTGSIAERVDLNPIENLGVTPDIQYTLTEEDVRGGFKNYATEISNSINGLLGSQKK